jgi:hypothetical protein
MVQDKLFSLINRIISKLSFTQSGSRSESMRNNIFIRGRSQYSSISQNLIWTIKSLQPILYAYTVTLYMFSSSFNYSLLPTFSSLKTPSFASTSLQSLLASLQRSLLHLLFFHCSPFLSIGLWGFPHHM